MNTIQSHIRIEKLTLNFGAGKDQSRLEKGAALIQLVSGIKPVRTITTKRIPAWGLRPGLPVGAKVTLRGSQAATMLSRTLAARDFKLPPTSLDDHGNLSFGVTEYIDIEGASYDPAIGILGLQVSVTLSKPGSRVKHRSIKSGKIGKRQAVHRSEAQAYLLANFKLTLGEQP